jgi:hemimethylated DNA binding protein
MSKTQFARYNIGQVIRHRLYDLRGVIFDVDASPAAADVGPATASVAQDKTPGTSPTSPASPSTTCCPISPASR